MGGGKICLGVLPALIVSLAFFACGGSEKDDGPEDVDAGPAVSDAGHSGHDAGHGGNDAGPGGGEDAGGGGGGTVKLEFISIPAGSYVLSHELVRDSGLVFPADTTVTLRAFSLQKTPVTVGQFEQCVAAGACTSSHYTTYDPQSLDRALCNYDCTGDCGEGNIKDHPMNCVDLAGANEYCKWIGGRLPTEDEWEYAATHNGTRHLDTKYPWGDSKPDATRANFNKCVTTEVGTYSPAGDSPLGLVDMSGNVSEWTDTLYQLGFPERMDKGGDASATYEDYCDESCEDSLKITDHHGVGCYPSFKHRGLGFRCVK